MHVNNWFAASAVRWAISQLRTSSERKLILSATRLPFTVEIVLLDVFSLSNSLFFESFLRLSDLSHRQEQAGSMPSTQAIPPSPGHNSEGSEKVRTFDKEAIATNRLIAKDSLASCGYATFNCPILSKYELLRASARRQIETGLFFSFKPLSISLRVCLGTPFEFFFTLDHDFFLRNDKYGQEMKISSKGPTSAITSPPHEVCEGMLTETRVWCSRVGWHFSCLLEVESSAWKV